jgi:hypothetical protein
MVDLAGAAGIVSSRQMPTGSPKSHLKKNRFWKNETGAACGWAATNGRTCIPAPLKESFSALAKVQSEAPEHPAADAGLETVT